MLSINSCFVLTEKWVGEIWGQHLILGFKYIIAELARAKRAQQSAKDSEKWQLMDARTFGDDMTYRLSVPYIK